MHPVPHGLHLSAYLLLCPVRLESASFLYCMTSIQRLMWVHATVCVRMSLHVLTH
jgi:hypothetical protein